MVDNVAITAGAGTTIATDDVGGTHYQINKLAFGALDTATLVSVTNPIPAGFLTVKVSSNFNRPADTTAYAANDAVNNNTAAGSVTKLSWSVAAAAGVIRRIRIRKSDQTVATPIIRLWLWDTTFTVATGDNAAFSEPLADTLGFVDVAMTNAGTDDAVGYANCDIPFTGATVYGLLQTLSAFTPANAETFTMDLWYLPG